MEQIHNIKFLFNRKGKSLRSIAKETGHDFETVKKYVEKDDFNIELKKKSARKGKLDPYKYLIDEWLTIDLKAKPKQRHTAQRVYTRLKEMYGDEFNVSERAVREYVSKKKKELNESTQGYLPLEHIPSEAQADFGEAEFTENGVKITGYYLNLSFPYSNAGFLQVFKGQNLECVLEGLKSIFNHIGCVPTCIWFDNMSAIVKAIKKHGEREVTDGFMRFSLHYGFESNFCNPNSGHEKGNVENKVGYHRRNFFVPIPAFNDMKAYNLELFKLSEANMERKHYKLGKEISELFTEDKNSMKMLPKTEFEIFRLEKAKADNYGKVKFDNHIYSTSPDCAGKQVWVKAGAFEIKLLDDNYNMIETHSRLYGEQKESMKWLPYLNLMSRRPNALKYSGFFKELPLMIQEYFEKCDYSQKKASLGILSKMVRLTDLNTATKAFEDAVKRGLTDTDSIWMAYHTITYKPMEAKDLKLDDKLPEVKTYKIDSSVYDNLLKGGDVNGRHNTKALQ